MIDAIGVTFENGPKVHYVEAPPAPPAVGARCVVTTRRGVEVARVRTDVRVEERTVGHVLREADRADLEAFERLRAKADDLKWLVRARVRDTGSDAKIVALEFTLDEQTLVVNYGTEGQAPLRAMAQALMAHTDARLEFVNVGPRDQARMFGTLGRCGSGSCSSTWLQSFSAVSIRMARDQQLPLNPEKITGPCGRLMCCLQYEHEQYRELLKGMPKKGGQACHEESGVCGRVVKVSPLVGTVELRTGEGEYHEFPAAEVRRVKGGS
jgi:cell fate regulator YaaT (PSP1 superfamily)